MVRIGILSYALLAANPFLIGCSNGSSSADPSTIADELQDPASILTGILEDSAVEGASFSTDTQSGTTNRAGEFQYVKGENVTFSIGNLLFPTVIAEEIISPFELSEGSGNPDTTATNIARLLQSLDEDGYPYNGITISRSAQESASPVDFNVSIAAFEQNPDVLNLVANSGSVNTSLISTENTIIHLHQIDAYDDFFNRVVGRQLVLRSADGTRDESSQTVVNADGTATGITPAGNIALEWFWDEQFYCRSGTSASGQTNVAMNCQVVSIQDDLVTFVLDKGAGEISTVWFIE